MNKSNSSNSFIKILTQVVNDEFEADINDRNRRRNTVDARKMFVTVLRDLGWTYLNIADVLNCNHATVIYNVNKMKDLMSIELELRDKYNTILELVGQQDYELRQKTKSELRKEVLSLRKKNNLLSLKVEELQDSARNLVIKPL